ncbi:penicillin-binding protein 2 [Candidatus Dojkabacteria bacterium]|uniref:Penicillin-binding protein 2 n=1 Tax=Candidatus Dojkabacteria bacterium TaxID=2099670 RepID=A0A955HZP9_9BACT|nr:penicillin-binding protein 2 [Candidatus Dojkabacteria bacterium]MCB9790741.1 penicillin-binding protein 2 [Candidatus Nomurabacteria bacterium]
MKKRTPPAKGLLTKQSSQTSKSGTIFNLNTTILFVVTSIFAVLLVFQMGRWQIIHHQYFNTLAQSQYLGTQRQSSTRGVIYASDGTVLSTDDPTWDIYASLSSIKEEREAFFKQKDKFVATVSGILGLKKNDLDKELNEEFRYVPLLKNASIEQKKALEEVKIFDEKPTGFGLSFEESEKRIYPNGTLASHVLGFMGKTEDGQDKGVYGIEGYFYGALSGTEGLTYEEQDANGNVILTTEYEPVLPREGKDITLTIKPGVQAKVEEALKKGVEDMQAKSGSAIIMNPKTGEIWAMANYPDFDPNEYWRVQDPWIFKNKAIADVYEPGSVIKPLTVSIGLETEAIDENTKCNDSTGFIKIYEGTPDEKIIYTWDGAPDGVLVPREYLQYSNNPCIVRTALKVGFDNYYPKLKEFGIGQFVGLGLEGENNSYLMPYKYWTEIDFAVASFGQSISATPMQVLSAISTIANGGKRMQPYIIESVSDDDEVIKYKPRVLSEPISEKVANSVADMMRSVVRKGDPKWIFNRYLEDYDIAGKTGTAQVPKPDEPGYYDDRTNATFIGFAPVDNPRMIMLVRLEEPGIDIYSATTAAPVWVNIFLQIADDLEIPKTR